MPNVSEHDGMVAEIERLRGELAAIHLAPHVPMRWAIVSHYDRFRVEVRVADVVVSRTQSLSLEQAKSVEAMLNLVRARLAR